MGGFASICQKIVRTSQPGHLPFLKAANSENSQEILFAKYPHLQIIERN